jgi:16S rRNA (uracil1498-N3)-methyltransferase
MEEGRALGVFNGRDGTWEATLAHAGKRACALTLTRPLAPFAPSPDVWLCFAPVKGEKSEEIVKRATELGVSRIQPVLTQHTVMRRINRARLKENAVQAAEQCERHDVPEVMDALPLEALLAAWPQGRALMYGDESGGGAPVPALLPTLSKGAYAALIGPEGGFSAEEHALLARLPFARAVCLGPRILRAETAAAALLANLMAWVSDWEQKPRFLCRE